MNICIIRSGIILLLVFLDGACNTPVGTKTKTAGVDTTHAPFQLTNIDSTYYGPLVDTILNHSVHKFQRTVTEEIDFFHEPDSFLNKQLPTLMKQAFDAKKHCEKLFGNKPLRHKLRIIYFSDREQLRPFLKMAPKGSAMPDAYTLLIATNDSLRAYHTHELMHIISIAQLGGYAEQPSDWIQEGLSVYADNPCLNYPIHAIAANLLYTEKSTAIDSLFYHFRTLPDLEAYIQAGSLVQYFIEYHGMEKFTTLWQKGVGALQQVINLNAEDFEKAYQTFLKKQYKQKPVIDWELLGKKVAVSYFFTAKMYTYKNQIQLTNMETKIFWKRKFYHSIEHCTIATSAAKHLISSTIIRQHQHKIYPVYYSITTNKNQETM